MKKRPKARTRRVKQPDTSGNERETNDDKVKLSPPHHPEISTEMRGKGLSPESMERLRKAGKVW